MHSTATIQRYASRAESQHKKVAGDISGAGGFKPRLIFGADQTSENAHLAPIALVGKFFCKVDEVPASIEVGDLLTTSTTKGHAMKAADATRAYGAVIGKALKCVPQGQKDLNPILLVLQ
jgi:hypothetical protein